MTWWQWLLISIGAWLVVGFGIGLIYTYVEGRAQRTVDNVDVGMSLLLWPLLAAILIAEVSDHLIEKINRLGRTHDDRKEARLLERQVQTDMKKLGIKYRKD